LSSFFARVKILEIDHDIDVVLSELFDKEPHPILMLWRIPAI
jgi:hypothetical protein